MGKTLLVAALSALLIENSHSFITTSPLKPVPQLLNRNTQLWSRVEFAESKESLVESKEPLVESNAEIKTIIPGVPKGKQPEFAIEGDSLENEPIHIALTAGFWILSGFFISSYAASIQSSTQALLFVSTCAISTVFSDMFSGIFHWAVDNYGNGKTPVLGAVIEAFQGHHSAPWTITYRPFANNVHKICKAAIPLALIAHFSPIPVMAKLFTVLWLCFQVLSQEFHKYSHMITPPKIAQILQKKNIIISRKVHGLHHSSPFEGNYCILTGWCNSILDNSKLFRALEKIIYERNGVEPNCWKLDEEVKKEALSLW